MARILYLLFIGSFVLLLSACETADSIDLPDIKPVSIRPQLANPDADKLIEDPSTILLSYEALREGITPQAYPTLQYKAGLSLQSELIPSRYFVDLYNTEGETFGYYLPITNTIGGQNHIVFLGWSSFANDPLKPRPYINLEKALEHGLPFSKWAYGLLQFVQEYSSPEDKARGLEVLTQSAEAGDLDAIFTLGQLYSEGRPWFRPDYEKALYWFAIGEEKDDPNSLLGLAKMYEGGKGVVQDYELALEYYTRAAEYGLPEAAYLLGYIFMNGTITDVRIPSGVFWIRIASNKGYAPAQYFLAGIFAQGTEVPQSDEMATYWLQQAARQNHAESQYYLAGAFQFGRGIEKDESLYLYWMQESAKNGYADAQQKLANLYAAGDIVDENQEAALYWYAQAADQGGALALRKVADYYREGEIVPQNYARSRNLYELAAEAGDAYSLQWLGRFYQQGYGVTQNDEQAIYWYEQAIAQGDYAYSHYNLGRLLWNSDISAAFEHWFIAADKGYESAIAVLIGQFAEGKYLNVDVEQSLKWLKVGVERKNTQAMVTLAMMYTTGNFVEENEEQYLHYMTQAAEAGDGLAPSEEGTFSGNPVYLYLDDAKQFLRVEVKVWTNAL